MRLESPGYDLPPCDKGSRCSLDVSQHNLTLGISLPSLSSRTNRNTCPSLSMTDLTELCNMMLYVRHSGRACIPSYLGALRQEDCFDSGIQDHPEQHSKSLSLNKTRCMKS